MPDFTPSRDYVVGSRVPWLGVELEKKVQGIGELTAKEQDEIWEDSSGIQFTPTLTFEQGNSGPDFNKFAS